MTSPSARALRVHFRDFAIGSGRLWVHSEDGQAVGPYSGTGQYDDGDFWSGIVFGDSLTIEYLPEPAAAGEAVPFQIAEISHIWGDVFGDDAEGSIRQPESAWGSSDRSGAAKLLPGRIDPAVGTPSKKARLTKSTKALPLVKRSASLQPPIRQINPGQTLSFRVGPVDDTTLFRGDDALQLEVPEDATRVSVTLESDADVALLVRYGEDIELQDGEPIFDYGADEVLAGTEEVVITSDSDPPLRAGTYFIGIVVADTGVVVHCRLTAEVEREGGTSPPTEDNTLTPGQPVSFQRGPVDTPSLFARNDSFLLEVPEDATRVTFHAGIRCRRGVVGAFWRGQRRSGQDDCHGPPLPDPRGQ